jgi:hypothetical protein
MYGSETGVPKKSSVFSSFAVTGYSLMVMSGVIVDTCLLLQPMIEAATTVRMGNVIFIYVNFTWSASRKTE